MDNVDQPDLADHVFLSYSREDQAAALPIIGALENQGIKVWWDGLIDGGAKFGNITEDALEKAYAVVVIWSQTSVQSHWVKDEATRGRDRGRLVPISIDGSEPPLGFRQFQCLNLSGQAIKSSTPSFNRLVNSIRALQEQDAGEVAVAGSVPVSASSPKPIATLSRRSTLLGAGAAIVVSGGLGYWLLGPSGRASQANSIAVLPFRALGDGDEQAYFAEGLAAEVRGRLARNPLLKVSAQSSSSAIRESGDDAVSASKQLGVSYLLDGNVRRSGNAVRVVAELIDGATGFTSWSVTYDRLLDDIFEIQEAIATSVTQALSAEMDEAGSGQDSDAQIGGTTSVAAYEAYLRGRDLFDAGIDESSDRHALAKFEEAIVLDGNYAAAHAGRGRTLGTIGNLYASPAKRQSLYRDAIAAANTSVSIAPKFADGHSVLGFSLAMGTLNMAKARGPYRQSYLLGSGDADVLSRYAIFRARIGDYSAAREAIDKSSALDPLNARTFRSTGDIAYGARRFDDALASFEKAKSIQDGLSSYHYSVGLVHLATGAFDKARQAFAEESRSVWQHTGGAIAEFYLNNPEAAQQHLDRLKSEIGAQASYQFAQIYAQWGRIDDALAALTAAWDLRDSGLVQMYNDPLLDPLRKATSFKALVQKIGFAN